MGEMQRRIQMGWVTMYARKHPQLLEISHISHPLMGQVSVTQIRDKRTLADIGQWRPSGEWEIG
jgi:hypothetical protein